jgi:hypothetical protein
MCKPCKAYALPLCTYAHTPFRGVHRVHVHAAPRIGHQNSSSKSGTHAISVRAITPATSRRSRGGLLAVARLAINDVRLLHQESKRLINVADSLHIVGYLGGIYPAEYPAVSRLTPDLRRRVLSCINSARLGSSQRRQPSPGERVIQRGRVNPSVCTAPIASYAVLSLRNKYIVDGPA